MNGADTVIPFSGGAIYLGQYSADTTIDVSDLGATSASQFLAVCDTSETYSIMWTATQYSGTTTQGSYTAPEMSLNNNTLSLKVGVGMCRNPWASNLNEVNKPLLTKVYFVGDIETK